MELSGEAFGALFGVSRAAVSQWESKHPGGRTTPNVDTLQKMCEVSGAPPNWLFSDDSEVDLAHWADDNVINLAAKFVAGAKASASLTAVPLAGNPEYPAVRRAAIKAQAGVTGFAIEYLNDDGPPIVFRKDWFKMHGYRPEQLLAVKVGGDSMVPNLQPGDLIVVNCDQTTPRDGVAFVLAYEGEVVVKRMVRDQGQWWLSSDNPDQRRYPRKLCDENTQIIGEVIYRQTEHI